jgi:acyl carrier protein
MAGEQLGCAPSVAEFVAPLQGFTAEPLDLDRPVFEQRGIDSLDVVNWLYSLLEHYDIELEAQMEELVEHGSLRDLHAAFSVLVFGSGRGAGPRWP